MGLRAILVASASLAAVSAAAPAAAQTAPPSGDTGQVAPGAGAASASTEIEGVVVTGLRRSLQQAIDIKRASDSIVDVVSAADIGKLPDKNIADSLQRVPGVNTVSAASGEGGFDENDRVSIRGTNPSLTQTLVDGHSIANGDWFILDQFQTVGRSVSYTLLPSEIVKNVVVYKSQQADLVEGGVSGSVDIVTRKPLDFTKDFTFEAQAQGEYSDLPGTWQPNLNALASWKSPDGQFGVMAQGFYEKRDIRRDGVEVLGYAPIGAADATGKAIPSLVGVQYPTLIGAALFKQTREREGGSITGQWRPSNQFEVSLTGFYSQLKADNQNSNFLAWESREIANNVPSAYTVRNNTLVGVSFPLNGPAGTPVAGVVVDNIFRPGAEGKTGYVNLDATWRPMDNLTVTGKIGYTEGKGLTPSQPAYEAGANTGLNLNLNGVDDPPTFNWPNINPADGHALTNDLGWSWSDKATAEDKEFYAQADADLKVDLGPINAVKWGGRIAEHRRDVIVYDHGSGAFAGTTLGDFQGGVYPSDYADSFKIPGFPTNLAIGDPAKIIPAVEAKDPPVLAGAPNTYFYWPGSFGVHEVDTAGYAMVKFGGDRWHGNAGVRVVGTDENIKVYVSGGPAQITTSVWGNYTPTKVGRDYLDILPSINVSFDVTHDFVIRVAASETMSRPDYSALGGSVSLTDLNHTGNGGNPNLKPIKAATYDASFEWYFAPQSLLAVDFFDLEFSNYVSYGVSNGDYFSLQDMRVETYAITSPINSSGHDRGVEASWQQPIWRGFGVLANATYAMGKDDSGGPLVGGSKYTANVTGYYENKWLSARLAYNYRSAFLVGLDRSSLEYQDEIGTLDATLNVNITPNLALEFDARNLTDSLLKYYAANRDQPRAIYDNGRQFYAGVRFKY